MKKAVLSGVFKVSVYNLRDFTLDRHRTVDDRPFGGGPGMVLKAEPYLKAYKAARGKKKKVKTVMLSPRGEVFTSNLARAWVEDYNHIIFLCGHYEGIDARALDIIKADPENNYEEVSLGDFVVTGGELPALVMTDTTARFLPGVLGNPESLEESRAAARDVYTRPAEFMYKKEKHTVPEVLLSGDHKLIDAWREDNAQK